MNLFLADGVVAGQEIFHVHLHVIPRRSGDGMRLSANWRLARRTELDQIAATIKAALA